MVKTKTKWEHKTTSRLINELFIDSCQSRIRDLDPSFWVHFALLEEVDELFCRFISCIWVYVKTRHTINNDLCRPTITGCKGGQPTCHSFNHSETKCFIQSWLQSTKIPTNSLKQYQGFSCAYILLSMIMSMSSDNV